MFHVHEYGIGVCGSYSFEVAETKVESVHGLAEQYEFPLQATMEEN
jgi:ATP-dependent Clp protease adaptor protein ClpS